MLTNPHASGVACLLACTWGFQRVTIHCNPGQQVSWRQFPATAKTPVRRVVLCMDVSVCVSASYVPTYSLALAKVHEMGHGSSEWEGEWGEKKTSHPTTQKQVERFPLSPSHMRCQASTHHPLDSTLPPRGPLPKMQGTTVCIVRRERTGKERVSLTHTHSLCPTQTSICCPLFSPFADC